MPPADEWVKLAKTDHVALLKKGRDEYTARGVQDLTCTFIKQDASAGRWGKSST